MKSFCRYPFLMTILSLSVFLLSPAADSWAKAPWGLVAEYGEKSPEEADFHNDQYTYFATHKMLTNTPITYAIKFDDYEGRTQQTDEQWTKKTDALIRAAFYRWPKSVERAIHASGRAQEFQDILDLLKQHPLILQRTDESQADIVFHFDEYKSADFLYNREDLSKQKTIRMENPAKSAKALQNLPHFLAHEIGHYYGLGDRYQEGISGSSPLYSTTEGTDGDALMALAKGPEITKDDVDGFINLIDVTLAFETRKFSKRSEKGWTSFDSPRRVFARGQELNRQAFFDGNTIYYYNEDGSIKNRREATTVGIYNPFAEENAKRGPFEAIQYVSSAKTDIDTVFNYTHLNEGRISGKSVVANLTMLTFDIKRTAPKKWDLQLSYERTIKGFNEKQKYLFTVQQMPQTCRISINEYDKSMKNIHVEINPATGQFSLQAQALDLPDDSMPYHISASGTDQDANFTYTQGNNTYRMLLKDGSYYDEQDELINMGDKLFFITDNISWMRKLLNDEYHFCTYLNALKK